MKPDKPHKAPLALLPARALRAVSAALEAGDLKHGASTWRQQTNLRRYHHAAMRHLTDAIDPDEPDTDPDTGLHHLVLAAANLLILCQLTGLDYVRPLVRGQHEGS
jgi:hypothetical protein